MFNSMSEAKDNPKYREVVDQVWNDIMWGKPNSDKLKIADDILADFLKNSSEKDKKELEDFLWRWDTRVKFIEALREMKERKRNSE